MELSFYDKQSDAEPVLYERTALDSQLWVQEKYTKWGLKAREWLLRLLDETPGERNIEILDELFYYLCHQLTLFDVSYLAFPHLVHVFEQVLKEEDFIYTQYLFSHMGVMLAADSFGTNAMAKPVLENYQASIRQFQRLAKQFLDRYQEQIRQAQEDIYFDRGWFSAAVLATLGDQELAFILITSNWEPGEMSCSACGYYYEELFTCKERAAAVAPAVSVIGGWDGRSYQNTWLWFANFLHGMGMEKQLRLLSHYYETYTCPQCGQTSLLVDWMKCFQQEENK
ncbi:MAG: hypothetical protein HFI75_05580 [Lachnospiraceae bacterium]|nr:hypothetical protein [Lachnospiraceae bacterium]